MEPISDLVAPAPTRAIPPAAKAFVLFNEMAGSVGAGDREKLVATLAAGDIGQYALIDVDRVSPELFARAKDFDVIIVLGGDGTARAAAGLEEPVAVREGGQLDRVRHRAGRDGHAALRRRRVVALRLAAKIRYRF